jgi:hypothetical protein
VDCARVAPRRVTGDEASRPSDIRARGFHCVLELRAEAFWKHEPVTVRFGTRNVERE